MFPMQNNILEVSDTALVIPAGGSSSRFGNGNKLLQNLAGIPVFQHCIRTIGSILGNKNIYLAVPKADIPHFSELCEQYLPQMDITIVPGGKSRTESVLHALEAITSDSILIAAIHDAARPFVTRELFIACVNACRRNGGALSCHKICDTVKLASPDLTVSKTVSRDFLWAAETPQVFLKEQLLSAYRRAVGMNTAFTDDAQVMELICNSKTVIVENKKFNGKITYSEDLLQARMFLNENNL